MWSEVYLLLLGLHGVDLVDANAPAALPVVLSLCNFHLETHGYTGAPAHKYQYTTL